MRNCLTRSWRHDKTCSSTPNSRRVGQVAGLTKSPQSFSRGNCCLSMSATEYPLRARKIAVDDPAGPAPTMATSKRSIINPEEKSTPLPETGKRERFETGQCPRDGKAHAILQERTRGALKAAHQ